jgi:nicotinamide-nucleotide amidase
MKISIITIGDEILIGQTIDTNSAWMGKKLNAIGAQIHQIVSVGDDLPDIIQNLEKALQHSDVVLLTGGLGPTKDDVTKKALCEFFGVDLVFHQPTYDRILKLFEKWGRSTTEAHRLQCFMPGNAELLYNKMGTAPGMWFEKDGKVVVSMPGVPYEMKYLMETHVISKLKATFPGQPIVHRTIQTVGEGESRIAFRLEDIESALPAHIKLAFLPNLGKVRLRLTGKGPDQTALEHELDEKVKQIVDRIPELIFGFGEIKLEAAIGQMLKERQLKLATAESCTGGFLAHMITSVPGSSDYFQGSIIAYANAVKMNQLGVKADTLNQQGAVSEATVREMVTGALDLLQTDLAVATSGVAGPGGGSEEKPVGTVWMAVGNNNRIKTRLIRAGKDRIKNIEYSSVHALNLIREFLLEEDKLQKGISLSGQTAI